MFDLVEGTLTFGNRTLPIVKWEVWFMTPFGLIEHLKDACARCAQNEIEPNGMISPVPVALDSDERYEIIVRG